MAAFITVLKNVLIMLVYIICGYGLVKSNKAQSSHAKSLSAFLIYICCPCLMVSSFLSMDYSMTNFRKSMTFLGVTFTIQLLFFIALYAVLHKKYEDAKYRILSVCGTLGNVGFFGLPIVTGLFPTESIVACYSTVYVVSMNLLVFTMGVFLITTDKRFISVKAAIINPTTLSFLVALPLYLCQAPVHSSVMDTISLLGKMTTPLCMVIIGFRLASIELKRVFTARFAYGTCLVKLLIFPVFAYLCVCFFPWFDETFKVCVFVLSSAPSGAAILSLAELHECEQKTTANAVLLTTLLSIITVPLMLLLVK